MNIPSSSAKKYAYIKIFIMIAVISVGSWFIVDGYFKFIERPTITTHGGFDADFNLPSGQAEFRITFDAYGGFYPGADVGPRIQLTLQEEVANSTDIQVVFPEGRIISVVERKQVSVYDDPVSLNFHDTAIDMGKNVSRYTANPNLRYDVSGPYGAEIHIDSRDSQEPYEDKWSNVVEIKSRDYYTDRKNDNEQFGFALIILGIALIATAPTFAKVFEYYEDTKKMNLEN